MKIETKQHILTEKSDRLPHEFNQLKEGDLMTQKRVISDIFKFLQTSKTELSSEKLTELLSDKIILIIDCFDSKSDFIRETSAKIIDLIYPKFIFSNSEFKYLIQKLVERSNCYSLDSFDNLPEEMRPTPTTLPVIMISITEKVEEIRHILLAIVCQIVECTEKTLIIKNINDLVNILRVFLMDQEISLQTKACQITTHFIGDYCEELVNFADRIARSLLLSLVSQKSKVKISALRTLEQLMFIGAWKQSYATMDLLIGFRDPNSIAIKEFYEPSFKINYLAILINDEKRQVREAFLNVLENWFLNLKDKEDHHPRLLCYLLTFLFDKDIDIQAQTVGVIEEIGKQVEREKEQKFREFKQIGVDSEWCRGMTILPGSNIEPFDYRPRLGARFLIQCNLSKIIPAIKRELKDSINPTNRLRTLKLLKYMIFLGEDSLIEHIPSLFVNFIRNLKIEKNQEIQSEIEVCCVLLGRYCRFDNPFTQLSTLISESDRSEGNTLPVLILLKSFVFGHFSFVPEGSRHQELFSDFEKCLEFCFKTDIDFETSDQIMKTAEDLYQLINKISFEQFELKTKGQVYEEKIFEVLFRVSATKLWQEIYSKKSFQIDQTFQNERTIELIKNIVSKIDESKISNREKMKYVLFGLKLSKIIDKPTFHSYFTTILKNMFDQSEKVASWYKPVYSFLAEEIQKCIEKKVDYIESIERFFDISLIMIKSVENENNQSKSDLLKIHLKISKSYFSDSTNIQNSKNVNILQEEIIRQLLKMFTKEKSIDIILVFKDFMKFYACKFLSIGLHENDLYLQLLSLFAMKVLFIEESTNEFEKMISTLLIAISRISIFDDKFAFQVENTFDEVLRVYWSIRSEELRKKIKDSIIVFFKKKPLLLTEAINKSEKEGKLRKFDFLREIFHIVLF